MSLVRTGVSGADDYTYPTERPSPPFKWELYSFIDDTWTPLTREAVGRVTRNSIVERRAFPQMGKPRFKVRQCL